MPLIKTITNRLDAGYDYRRREELLRSDLIRVVVNGMQQSIRASGLGRRPELIITNTLQQLAEDGVVIDSDICAAYAESQRLLCLQMSKLFAKAASVGVSPGQHKSPAMSVVATDYTQTRTIPIEPGWAWFPVSAYVTGAEITVLLRICSGTEIELALYNSAVMGMTLKDLDRLFPELAEYVSYIENKASEDPSVSHAFRHLMQLLCPAEAARHEAIERAERYKGVNSFGAWG